MEHLHDSTLTTKSSLDNRPEPGTREFYQWMGRRGGRARAAMPCFKQHQRRAGKRSAEVNDMSALGRRGAQVTMRRYGYGHLFECVRQWRLGHPSSHEQQVMAHLDYLNYPYEREAIVIPGQFVAVDFYLPDCDDAIIEVEGRVHTDPRFDHPRREQTRRELDAHRRRKLERSGYRVLVLTPADLGSAFDTRLKIVNFLLGGIA